MVEDNSAMNELEEMGNFCENYEAIYIWRYGM